VRAARKRRPDDAGGICATGRLGTRSSPPTRSTRSGKTAEHIAGERESDYFLFVKRNQPSLQRAVFDAIQEQAPGDPDHSELDRSLAKPEG
jgi:hypothetical protein